MLILHFPPMLRGVKVELCSSGYDLLIHSTLDGRGRRPLTEHNTDAFPTVTVENKAGAEAIVSHMIETHGKQRIIYLRGPDANEDSAWRKEGYRAVLAAHRLPFDPALGRQAASMMCRGRLAG